MPTTTTRGAHAVASREQLALRLPSNLAVAACISIIATYCLLCAVGGRGGGDDALRSDGSAGE
jgi:hypothetical protein